VQIDDVTGCGLSVEIRQGADGQVVALKKL
jgi:hypothetical protein